MRTTLDERTSVAHEIVRFPEAEHGFNCDQRPSYHPQAAAEAWERTLAWFAEAGRVARTLTAIFCAATATDPDIRVPSLRPLT